MAPRVVAHAALVLAALSFGGAGAAQTAKLCDAVRSPERGEFVTSIDDRLFVRPEFDYYTALVDEDRRAITEFAGLLRRQGLSLVVAPVPYKADVYVTASNNPLPGRYEPTAARARYQDLLATLRKTGIAVVDGEEVARSMPAGQAYYTLHDHHWTGEAISATADRIAKIVDTLNLPLDRTAKTTLKPVQRRYDGSIADVLKKSCGFEFAKPEQRTFFDVRVEGAEGLLGEARKDVVLVGDSFAISYFGMPGVLTDRLGTPVVDASVNGGGCCSGLMGYFAGLKPGDAHPKVLVWNALNPLFTARSLREYKPTVYRAYVTPQAVARQDGKLRAGTPLKVAFGTALSESSRYFVGVEFRGPKVENFDLTLAYPSGQESQGFWRKSDVTAPTYVTSYFYELAPGSRGLREVQLAAKMDADVTVTLYKYGPDAF